MNIKLIETLQTRNVQYLLTLVLTCKPNLEHHVKLTSEPHMRNKRRTKYGSITMFETSGQEIGSSIRRIFDLSIEKLKLSGERKPRIFRTY